MRPTLRARFVRPLIARPLFAQLQIAQSLLLGSRSLRTRALHSRFALLASLIALVFLPACASFNELTGPTVVPGVVAAVDIPTTQTKLSVGSTLALQAKIYDGSRNTIVDKSVLWTSSDSTIAKVSPEGVVTGIGVGAVRIAASVQGRSAVASLTVTARAVASILVNPPSPNILVGATMQLSSVTLGESGDILAGRSVAWQSSDPLVASVDNLGLLTGLAPGVTTITATSETRTASVGVTVLPVPVANVQISPVTDTVVVGQTTQLTAVPRDSIGAPLVDRPLLWTSGNQSIATVSASGLVIGVAAGTVSITGTSEGKSSSSTIVVLARPVGSVIVSPAQVSLNAGQTLKLTVLITDNNGTLLTNRPITYRSGNTNTATVSTDGTVTGVNEGSTTITVTSEGKTGTADVSVTASPISVVRINTPSVDMAIGATQRLSVTLLDASGNTLPARPVSWRSGATSVATIAADGTVTAISAGSVVMFATVEGKLASVTLLVRAITVVSVAVAPPSAQVYVGDALDLGAQPRDAGGAVIAGKAVVWTSSDDRIAVVSSTGRVRALAPGQVLITATVDGVSGSSAVTTLFEPVLSVVFDQQTLSVLPGGSATVVATARGRNGVVLPGRTITYQSLDPSIATVSNTGLVSGVRTGNVLITATSEGKVGQLQVTVSPAAVATVAVSLAATTRYVSQTSQATADVRDATGGVLTGRAIVWTSSNSNVATVSTTGLVTGVAPGTADIIATTGGKSGQATIKIDLVPVSSVTVALAQNARFVGQSTTATAATLDSIGGVLTGRPVVWTSSNTSVATVSATGVVSAIAQGTTNISAASEGKTGQAQLTVTLVPVAKVNVVLGSPTQFSGQTTNATITLLDANNNVLTGRPVVITSSAPSVATVTGAGLVTPVSIGTTNITAVSEGITGTAVYTVVQPPVATVSITLQQPARYTGQTTQADVVLRDPLNRVITGRPITYTSSNQSVATVSATGLVTAIAVGSSTITATSEGISGTATVDVTLIPVSTVLVTVTQSALQIGQTSQATAVTKDVNGVTLVGRTVTWASSDPNVVTVSNTGLISAIAAGNANVTATSEGVSTSVPIVVTLIPVASVSVAIDKPLIYIGYTAQVTSTTRDAGNNVLAGRLTTWTSSDQSVATVSPAGVVTGIAKGSATITGTSEGVTGTTTVTVDLAPVQFVTVSMNTTQLLVGDVAQATVATADANNRPLTGRVITYSSSNTGVATVSSTGAVTAVGAGSANIIATSEGITGQITVVVNLQPVASITVSLGNASAIPVGGTLQAQATLRDSRNNILTGRLVLWTAGDPNIISIDNNGLVTGLTAGTTTVQASSEGKSGQVSITVTVAPVASVSVTIGSPSIFPLQTTQATAVLRDANNNILSGRQITWQSSNLAVAIVGANGGILAALPGTATITATSEGISGSAPITVSFVPINTIDVSLAQSSVQAGATSQATATPHDASGNVLTGRTITWSSSNTAVATVNANGLATSVAPGSADITATSEGKTGFSTLTVTAPPPAPVAIVFVLLSPSTVTVGTPSQATASTRDASNNVLTGRTIVWASTNQSVATVDASGNVTTLAAGTTDITATSEGITASATLTVNAMQGGQIATVTVTLAPASVVVGATSQATVVFADANGSPINVNNITWASSDNAIATVDANGVVTAVAAGTASITATGRGRSGLAQITVTLVPVANVAVSLAASSVAVGQTTQATATATDANGATLTGRTVTWTSSDNNIATVSSTGVVSAVAAGTATITATVEGKTGSASVTVP